MDSSLATFFELALDNFQQSSSRLSVFCANHGALTSDTLIFLICELLEKAGWKEECVYT